MNALIITDTTAVRMNVVAERTQNLLIAGAKAMMIESLKEKLRNGVAHFVFIKKDGTLREAWGTTASNLMKANINGRGISRDSVNCLCYWDCEKGGFRSLRFENLVQVF